MGSVIESINMPDRRVPRPSKKPEPPGAENTEYPLNSGGVMDQKEEREEQKKALERLIEKQKTATESGGFGVKPLADVLSQKQQRSTPNMSGADNFLMMSYQDVLDFIYGENELEELVRFISQNDEYAFNPPTRDEFGQMLKFAISRKDSKVDSKDTASAEIKNGNRNLPSPTAKREYADPINRAFPVDTPDRTKAAHAYIHKYWNEPSKRGVTATYGKSDFVTTHKKIVIAMKNNSIEHSYLDDLDDVSGFSAKEDNKNAAAACTQRDVATTDTDSGVGLFNLKVGQQVVSFARGGMRAPGEIIKIDGAIANVQWESGLLTTELLVGLVPST
mgnify:CR=1 FL=1